MSKEIKVGDQQFTGHQKLLVALLAVTQFTVILDFMVISPLGDYLIKAFDISPKQFGFAVSSYAFSAGLSGLLTAGFADRYDRKKLLSFFYAGFILGTLMCALAPTYHLLVVARIITGLFGGVIGSISMTIVTDLFPLSMRGRAMSVVQLGFAASQVLGIPVGLYFANIWGWHAPFTMIVFMGLITVALVLRYMEPVTDHLKVKHEHKMKEHYMQILRQPHYRLAMLTTALVSIGGFLLQPFTSTFIINNLQVSQQQLPLIFMFTGISAFIIMPLVGKLSDTYDRYKMFFTGTIFTSVFIILYTNLWPSPLWFIIVVNILLFVGIMLRMVPATTYISAVPDLKDRGAFMSINSSLQQISGGAGAVLAGMVVVQQTKTSPIQHFNLLGYLNVAIMLFCLWLVYRVSVYVKNKTAFETITH